MFITQEEINEECLRIFQMEFANQVESKNKQHTIALIRPHVREVDEGGIFSPESFARHHKPISSAFTSS